MWARPPAPPQRLRAAAGCCAASSGARALRLRGWLLAGRRRQRQQWAMKRVSARGRAPRRRAWARLSRSACRPSTQAARARALWITRGPAPPAWRKAVLAQFMASLQVAPTMMAARAGCCWTLWPCSWWGRAPSEAWRTRCSSAAPEPRHASSRCSSSWPATLSRRPRLRPGASSAARVEALGEQAQPMRRRKREGRSAARLGRLPAPTMRSMARLIAANARAAPCPTLQRRRGLPCTRSSG